MATGGAGGTTGGASGQGGDEAIESRTPDQFPEETGQTIVAPVTNAQACTADNQCASGYCMDGFCCDNRCDNKCMACSAAKKGSGVDGVCGSIAYDTDPDNDCPYGACDGKNACKNYNGFSCTSTAQCLSNYCVDGYCCGNICMGACQACSAAKKGSGSNGICGSIAVNTDPDNECNPGECNGSGACNASPQAKTANGAACTSSAQCTSGYCADGVCCDSWCLGTCQACTAAKKSSGVDGVCGAIANDKDPDEECWGGACNGAGVCKQYNGVPCTGKSQCLSGYCVDGFCCGNVCTGLCYACSVGKKGQGYDGVCGPIAAGRDLENECNPGECNGSGTCNQPQTPQANGTTCVSGGQCASGNCIDGYCCDTTCSGLCQACSAAKKGSGANGTCGNIVAETDPDAECGVGGRCGGNGTCRYYNGATCTSATQCFSNYCVDGVCCGNVCTNTCYACSAAKKGQGNDGACGPIANTKDPDNECNPGECNGSGACNQSQTPQANGTACTLATQCVSGFCTDGVCCDNACSGTCDACTATKKGSGTNGTCGPIKYDTDPDNECYAGSCSGSSTCQFYNGLACTQTTECLSNYCVDGVCCGNVCTGKCSACSAAKKGGGVDGQCGVIVNNQDPDNECFLMCDGTGACQKTPNGVACTAPADCVSSYCVDGVCCNNACTTTCLACSAAKKGNGTDGSCGPIAADTDPDDECPLGKCDGAAVCTVLVANGSQCTMDAQCGSEHCIDGVCCNTVCNGACEACNLPGTAGTCTAIPAGQSDPNGTPACTNICDGNGTCVKNTGAACVTGSECIGRVCNRLVCETAQPANDLLVWRTIWELPPYWSGPYPTVNFKNLVANDDGSTSINGDTPCTDQTPCVLTGGFSATGVPSPSHWDGSDGTYHYFWETLYKAGPYAASAFYQKVTQFSCQGNWGDGYSTYIAGNRAGRTVHIAQTCDTFGNGTNFGDGVFQSGPVLVRQMPSGPNQVTNVPANITSPMAFGPSSEVYSIALGGGLTIYKSPAGGGATTVKSVPGSISSRGFDVDSTGNLIIAFGFTGSVNFGAGAMTASGTDLGLVKLDSNGNVVWQKRYAGSSTSIQRVVAGENGFGVIGSGSVNLGYGTATGAFVARFNTAGTALWHANPGGYQDTNNSGAVYGGWSTMIEDNGTGGPLSQKFTITVEKYNQCSGGAKCKAQAAACTADDQCGSGFCVDGVCCDGACTESCYACSAAKKGFGMDGRCESIAAGSDPDNECTGGACSGSWTGCALDNGQACANGTDCVSTFCVDGVCCDQACSGSCRACSGALTGGSDGQCGNVPAGTDPKNQCNGGTCSSSGTCTGAGNGALCTNGSECASTFCADGVCCDAACTGTCVACTQALKVSASLDGICGSITMSYDPQNECADGNCNGQGACINGNGGSCTTGIECYSGYCTDGVCCNSVCDLTCQACSAAKTGTTSGYCFNILKDTDPDAECGSQTCNGKGACYQTLGTGCNTDIQCLSGHCRDHVCCDKACTGACEACTAAEKGFGANGVCEPLASGTDPNDECIGSTCGVGGVCAAITCSTNQDCPTRICANGTCTGTVVDLSTYESASCALFLDGRIKCWGKGGTLGTGDGLSRGSTPSDMGANLPFVDLGSARTAKQIVRGKDYGCARLSNGNVTCWGNNSSGILGRGDTVSTIGDSGGQMGDNLKMVNLGTGKTATQIAAGDYHTCAILNDGTVKCWGANWAGQLGVEDNVNRGSTAASMGDNLPIANLGTGRTAVAIASGSAATCAILDNGSLKCWGNNVYGQAGTGDLVFRGRDPGTMGDNLPVVNLGTGKTAMQISMSSLHVCAVLNDASLKCWGSGGGALGYGDSLNRGGLPSDMGDNLPAVNLGTGRTAKSVEVGDSYSCALLDNGTVKCWGWNGSGRLGLGLSAATNIGNDAGEMGDNLPSVNLGTGKTAVHLDVGYSHACAILNDGAVKCWGWNTYGKLGTGTGQNHGEFATDMGDNLPVVVLQ